MHKYLIYATLCDKHFCSLFAYITLICEYTDYEKSLRYVFALNNIEADVIK